MKHFQVVSNTTRNCTCLEDLPIVPEETGWSTKNILGLFGACFLVCLSALFSGLTLGLLGLDTTQLEIVRDCGGPKERIYAQKILPVRRRGNLLLCTLLLGNVMVNAGISVLTSDLTSGLTGFLISSAVITIFGEILPQAVCSRHGLFIGAHVIWVIYIVMLILLPIAWPISFLLDKLLGQEMGIVFSKDELKLLVEKQATAGQGGLNFDEAKIVGGVLELSRLTVGGVMTPVDKTFMLEVNDKLDGDTMTMIWQTGHSRIPVYQHDRNTIVGLLFTKDLMLINPDDQVSLSTILTFYGREVIKVFPDTKLDEMLKTFKTGRSHIAIVHDSKEDENGGDPYYVTLGLVSLEDIIEEILRDEIVDETDVFIDNMGNKKVGRDRKINMFYGLRGIDFHRLTPKQVIAASSYLYKSLELFRTLPESYLHRLLGKSQVVQMQSESYLYEKNTESDFFALIMNGRVEVKSGTDNFISENGPWSYLGIRALNTSKFIPDFTARVIKDCSFVKIERQDFIEIVQQAKSEDDTVYVPPEMEWILKEKLKPNTNRGAKVVSPYIQPDRPREYDRPTREDHDDYHEERRDYHDDHRQGRNISPDHTTPDKRTTRKMEKKSLLNDSTGDEVINL